MCKKITSHWQPLFSKKMAAAASFSYKIGGGGLIFLQNWWRQGFGNITGGCSDMVWILVYFKFIFLNILFNADFKNAICFRLFGGGI